MGFSPHMLQLVQASTIAAGSPSETKSETAASAEPEMDDDVDNDVDNDVRKLGENLRKLLKQQGTSREVRVVT